MKKNTKLLLAGGAGLLALGGIGFVLSRKPTGVAPGGQPISLSGTMVSAAPLLSQPPGMTLSHTVEQLASGTAVTITGGAVDTNGNLATDPSAANLFQPITAPDGNRGFVPLASVSAV